MKLINKTIPQTSIAKLLPPIVVKIGNKNVPAAAPPAKVRIRSLNVSGV